MVFSSDPTQGSCKVMTIYGEYAVLGFAGPGDERWTDVKVPARCYDDIIFYKDQFYAVNFRGTLLVCDLDADQGPTSTVSLKLVLNYLIMH